MKTIVMLLVVVVVALLPAAVVAQDMPDGQYRLYIPQASQAPARPNIVGALYEYCATTGEYRGSPYNWVYSDTMTVRTNRYGEFIIPYDDSKWLSTGDANNPTPFCRAELGKPCVGLIYWCWR
jgi:hypothetical protein